jgi:RNA polymerase sigma-70 factor (ECF subfamily)
LEAQRRLTERFLAACQTGDLTALTEVLAEDVTSWSDGGGKLPAARQPVRGRDALIRFALGLMRKAFATTRFTSEQVNGGPALLVWFGETLNSVIAYCIADDQIRAVYAVVNPDKLAYIHRQLCARAEAT